jgi:hypothetical protein
MASKKDNRSVAEKAKAVVVGAAKQTAKDLINFGVIGGPAAAGAKVGAVAGKAVARAVAKEASPKVLKAANKAKGSGSMVNPKPAMGKKTATAAKRDVVVKTDNKVIPVKDKGYISKSGEKSIKVNTNRPTVRVVEKAVTNKTAANRTKSSNQLRYGGAKAETKRLREAVSSSELLPKFGAKVGTAAGAAGGVAAAKAKPKKN